MLRFLPYLITIVGGAIYATGLWAVISFSAPPGFVLLDPATWSRPTAFGIAVLTVLVVTGLAAAFNGSADWFVMSLRVTHTVLDPEGQKVILERVQKCLPNRPGVDFLLSGVSIGAGRIEYDDADWSATQRCAVGRRVTIEKDSHRNNSGNGREFVFRTPKGTAFPFPIWMLFLPRRARARIYEVEIQGKAILIDAFLEREEFQQIRFSRHTRDASMAIYFPAGTNVDCRAHRGETNGDLRYIDCTPMNGDAKPGYKGYEAHARNLKPGERLRISWEFPESGPRLT